MYIATPVRMPIRSNHVPGTILVRVYAAGLESGEAQLRAVPAASAVPDGIELPTVQQRGEPVHTAGRSSDDAASAQREQSAAHPAAQITIVYEDLQFPAGERESYRRQLDQFIRDRNPSVNTRSPVYHQLLQELSELMARGNGTLVADDYNFAALKHNESLGR
jgi:hypothetical protein